MVVTRKPKRLQSSVPGKKAKIPAPIHRSSAEKQVNHPSRKQDRASINAKQQSAYRIFPAKTPEGRLSANGKSRDTQPHSNNKPAVKVKGSTVSPRIARNVKKMQSAQSTTFTEDKSPKGKVSQKVGHRMSSIAEASSSVKAVPKESNMPSNVVPQTSPQKGQVSPNKLLPTQSPEREDHEHMNKKKAHLPSIIVAKRGSLLYSQLSNPSPPDSIKSQRTVVVETQNKLKSEVKLHSASTKIVKAKSVMLRSSKRKFRRTSISIICTRTVTGYLNTSNNFNSPSIGLAPKSLFSDVAKCKEVSKSLSQGQNHISPSQSKNTAIKDTQIKDGSDVVRSDSIKPKRKVLEACVTDEDAALVSANQLKTPKKYEVVSESKGLRSNVSANDSEVEADSPKDKKSKVKDTNAVSNEGLQCSIGGKDKNLAEDTKSPESEAAVSMVTKTKNKINNISSKKIKHNIGDKKNNLAKNYNFVKDGAVETVLSPKAKKSMFKNPSAASNKSSFEAKAKNAAGVSKSAKGDADESVHLPKVKKSKLRHPNVVSNKGLFEAKAGIVDGDSNSAKGETDELVPSPKKSKFTNPNTVSNKGLFEAKAKNIDGVSESATEEAHESVNLKKVNKSKKEKKQDDVPLSQRLRFSTRKRFPPCERWRGQRPLFRFKHGQGFVFAGISPGWRKDESAELTTVKRKQERRKKLEMKKKEISKPLTKTPVIDQNTKTEVDVTLHCPFDTVKWTAVAQGDKIPFRLAKTFVSEDVTFGFLDINPFERKGSQYSPEDNIHFVVVKGQLKVVIHQTEFLFNMCDSFIVPCAATYSIENVRSSKALLSFSTFRTPFFPHQEEMND